MQTQFESFLAEQIERYRGVTVPVKASVFERMFVKKAPCGRLHPNPDDEFCDPAVGPNYGIVSRYEETIRHAVRNAQKEYIQEPLIVEKIHPDGYRILNGHHRWAAAMRMGVRQVPVEIVNLTQAADIQKMLQNASHDRRVTLDLDEVVFCTDEAVPAEKALPFPIGKRYRERLLRGIPALFHYLKTNGYDIWVYTAKYYSFEYIRSYFRHYSVRLDGIITGSARKGWMSEETKKRMEELMRNQYKETLHIDSASVVRTGHIGKRYEVHSFEAPAAEWAQTVMKIVEGIAKERERS